MRCNVLSKRGTVLKRVWAHGILIPLIAVIIVAIGIVAFGELLLALEGTAAALTAVGIMVIITIVAFLLSRGGATTRTE